jgi:plastocyanin
MKSLLALLIAITSTLTASETLESFGVLKGSIKYGGEPPALKMIKIAHERANGCKHEQIQDQGLIVDPQTRGIKWAVIRVMGAKAPREPEQKTVEITQEGCVFSPRIVVIAPGSNVDILNPEKIPHNAHLIPLDGINSTYCRIMPANEIRMTIKGAKYFAEPELIRLQCDIHPWMRGFVVVHDPRFAAITAEDGKFEIKNIPAGKYKVLFNHDLGEQEKEFEIKKDETTDAGEILFKLK